MFYFEIPWLCKNFKGENLCFLNLHLLHAVRIMGLSLEMISKMVTRDGQSSKMRNKKSLQL